MNEIINIQKCLFLCEYLMFIDNLHLYNKNHKTQQYIKIKQDREYKNNIQILSIYKNIPNELQKMIYLF